MRRRVILSMLKTFGHFNFEKTVDERVNNSKRLNESNFILVRVMRMSFWLVFALGRMSSLNSARFSCNFIHLQSYKNMLLMNFNF